jgi:hypothetical protein
MPDDVLQNENDPVLLPFLSAKSEAEAEDCLNRLFEKDIIPQIRKVLASYLTLNFDEKEEIQSDAQERVLKVLQKLRASVFLKKPICKPIKNLLAYISTVTFNCRKDFISSKQPEWGRNDNRLRRMRDGGELFFFADDEGVWFVRLESQTETPSEMEFDEIVSRVRQKHPNPFLLKTQVLAPIILETAEGALPKNELIKAILEISGTANFEEIELPEEMGEYLNYKKDEELVAQRQVIHLRQIWDVILTFRFNLRAVLILSLKESGKTEVVTLLLKKRIATIKEIAEALEISLDEFSDIFARLPMSSREIADFLGIEDGENSSKEQKVDNLRSIARRLLRRRLGIRKRLERKRPRLQ